jgi:enoyl-CoA hydratase/carnithine racemase
MIRISDDGGLRIITLDRPDKANALTRAMLCDLVATLENLEGIKALILTGSGRTFSAGADLDEARAGLATDPVWEQVSGLMADAPILTIAALNGTLAGGAFGVALACDLRIAVPQARFFYPVMRLGFLPQPSDPARLAKLAGPSTARRILMAGEKLTAAEALNTGLIDAICPPDDLLAEARDMTADALQADPAHIAGIKRLI